MDAQQPSVTQQNNQTRSTAQGAVQVHPLTESATRSVMPICGSPIKDSSCLLCFRLFRRAHVKHTLSRKSTESRPCPHLAWRREAILFITAPYSGQKQQHTPTPGHCPQQIFATTLAVWTWPKGKGENGQSPPGRPETQVETRISGRRLCS